MAAILRFNQVGILAHMPTDEQMEKARIAGALIILFGIGIGLIGKCVGKITTK